MHIIWAVDWQWVSAWPFYECQAHFRNDVFQMFLQVSAIHIFVSRSAAACAYANRSTGAALRVKRQEAGGWYVLKLKRLMRGGAAPV